MDSFSKLFKKEHMGELVLFILFVIYLVMGYPTPEPVAVVVNSFVGKIFIFFIVFYLFLYKNPVLAVLSLFVVIDLIRRSTYYNTDAATRIEQILNPGCTDGPEMSQYPFTKFNQFPYTLEQEVVKKMAPIVQSGSVLTKPSFKPFLESDHDASPVNASD
jgi:hypothetical protein